MNNRILNAAVILLSLQIITSAQSFWQLAAPVPPAMQAYSTSVIGNKAYFWCESGQIYSTEDGGNSFTFYPWYAPYENVSIEEFASHGIAFADSLTGYIADISRGEFRTTDGGRHWEKMNSEYNSTSTWLVEFGNSKVGWKIGYGGTQKTTDAGKTWNYFKFPAWDAGSFSNIFALDASNLWILKSSSYPGDTGAAIWCSHDGGTEWESLNTGIKSDSLNVVYYTDLHMNPNGLGYAVGRIYRPQQEKNYGFILKTTNLGYSWTTQEFPDELYLRLEDLDDNICVVFGNYDGNSGSYKVCYRRTVNKGQSWEKGSDFEIRGNYNSFYTSAYIRSQNTILVSAASGMFKSTDGGKSFARLSSGRDAYADEVSFDNRPLSPDTQLAAVISSYYKDFILSRDGGRTWTLKHFPKDFNLDYTHLSISGNCMYLTERQFVLYKSTDFGDSWQKIYFNHYGGVPGVYALSPDSVVVEAYPYLCTSMDGGKNWQYAPLTGIFLNEIKVYSGLRVWGTGGMDRQSSRIGILYSSTDRGNNWRVQDLGSEDLTHVEFVDEMTGFASGGRKIYATHDGGNSWIVLSTNAVAFAFYDKYRGVIITTNSSLVTTDGGMSWNKSNYDFNSLEAKLFFNRRGDLFAASRGMLYIYPDALSQIPLPQKEYAPAENNFKVYPNHPNPFNPATTIRYEIPSVMHVELKVYDMLGREVTTLVNKEQPAGEYSVLFDGSDLPSGVYIYTIRAGKYKESKKLMLIK
ncbi:MAG TPA: YCF48-related protein [Ignavibacteriales bacterium]|nr:YCF48-related protein [Ignavibacteriales bacterium]